MNSLAKQKIFESDKKEGRRNSGAIPRFSDAARRKKIRFARTSS